MWRPWRQYISPKCLMSHLYSNGSSTECSRSVTTKQTDLTESQIVRASVLESHGWSSEPNRSQCKLRVQEINSLVFLLHFIFSFRLSYPFFYFT